MKPGNLVVEIETGHMGLVIRVDKDYFGARTSWKLRVPRGQCVGWQPGEFIGPNDQQIQDRVLVIWSTKKYAHEYIPAEKLEIIQ